MADSLTCIAILAPGVPFTTTGLALFSIIRSASVHACMQLAFNAA